MRTARVIANDGHGPPRPYERAILAHEALFAGCRFRPALRNLVAELRSLHVVVRMSDVLDGLADQFFADVAQHVAEFLIDVHQYPVEVHACDPDRGIVEHRAVTLFAFFALGNILRDADEVQRITRRVTRKRERASGPEHAPVLTHEATLDGNAVDFPLQQLLSLVLGCGTVCGIHDRIQRHASQFLLRVSHHVRELPICDQVAAIETDHHHSHRCIIERQLEAAFQLFAAGNVLDHRDKILRSADIVARRGYGPPRPHDAAVLAHETLLADPRLHGAVRELCTILRT